MINPYFAFIMNVKKEVAKMAFNDRLKESRTNSNLTQEQLAEKLGIAKSTLSGYESGNREPSIATVAKILDILNVDANYLYQDEVEKITKIVVDIKEREILEKYRALDSHGKEMVDFTLTKEYERSEALRETQQDNITEMQAHLMPNAAHERDIPYTAEERHEDEDMLD